MMLTQADLDALVAASVQHSNVGVSGSRDGDVVLPSAAAEGGGADRLILIVEHPPGRDDPSQKLPVASLP